MRSSWYRNLDVLYVAGENPGPIVGSPTARRLIRFAATR